MFEESIWAWMNSWFTPTVLFVLLNLMIATIAITSSLASQKPQQDQQALLGRSPSLLQRLKSINIYSYTSQDPTTADHETTAATASFFGSASVLQRLKSIGRGHNAAADPSPEPEKIDDGGDGDEAQSIDEIYSQLKGHVSRSKSDTKPRAGEAAPARLARKMKKSASAKSAFAHFEEAEARRPATVREARVPAEKEEEEEEEEVDARADDFINRFKQQLKLQRLDSIIRYKEMISRGGAK